MKKKILALVCLFLAGWAFGQDSAERETGSPSSFLSIHFTQGVSVNPETVLGDNNDVSIHPGPTVGMSLSYRLPAIPWLIGSLALLGEYHDANFKGSSGPLFGFAGYAQLGVLFDIVPAFSLGALFGPGYGYRSLPESSDPSDSGAGFSILGGIFGWYRISTAWSLGLEIGTAMMPPSYGSRLFLATDVGYHFSEHAGRAAEKATPQPVAPQPSTPQPSTPEPERPRQPSWLSLGAGAAVDLTTWGDMQGNVFGISSEIKEEMKPIDIKAFVDLTYLQVSAGYMMVNGATGTIVVGGSTSTVDLKGSMTYVSLAAYLKYPFHFGVVTVFPLLGVEYKWNLTYKDGSGNDLKPTMTTQEKADLNELWFEGGAGMDFTIGSFYIRPEVIIGFKPLSATDNNVVSAAEASGWSSVSFTYLTINLNLLIGFNL